MADGKYIAIDPATGRLKEEQAAQTSAGAGDANKVPRLNANGKIDDTMLPALGVASRTINASENLAAGDKVNIYDNSGTEAVRKANASDVTKPCHGYVKDAVTSGNPATVYTDGQNTAYPIGSFVAADVGATVFLSTTGGQVTKTPPAATGNLLQRIGEIVEVTATNLVIRFSPDQGITRA